MANVKINKRYISFHWVKNFYHCFIKRLNQIVAVLILILKTSLLASDFKEIANFTVNKIDNTIDGDNGVKLKNLLKAKIIKKLAKSKKPNFA